MQNLITQFTLVLNLDSNKYAVLENGIKVRNDIFDSVEDFKKELKALGFDKPYQVHVAYR